jgi:hypothetical protein
VRAEAVEEPDGGAGRRDADVDMGRERRLAPREHAHRLADLAIARVRGDDRVVGHRVRVRPRDGRAQALLGQRLGESSPHRGELVDCVADAPVDAGHDLHHGGVRLERHAFLEVRW